jgi:hypothetical protein
MNKIKERGRRKAALSDRKSAAAQARMKNIASLAADERVSKKKRKAGAGKFHNPSNYFCSQYMQFRGHVRSGRRGLADLSQTRTSHLLPERIIQPDIIQ